MSFLPENYQEPTASNYVKLEQGTTKLRILTNPIMGWEYWVEDSDGRRPVRVKEKSEVPQSQWNDTRDKPKFFWAMLAWNYNAGKAQIWEITQSTIRKTLTGLAKSENWGDPKNYDINIEREGEGLDTEYTTLPVPPKEFEHEDKLPVVNIQALFDGEDPFKVDAEGPVMETENEEDVDTPKISKALETEPGKAVSRRYFALAKEAGFDGEQAKELAKKAFKLDSYSDITIGQLTKMLKSMEKRINEKEEMSKEEQDALLDEVLGSEVDWEDMGDA